MRCCPCLCVRLLEKVGGRTDVAKGACVSARRLREQFTAVRTDLYLERSRGGAVVVAWRQEVVVGSQLPVATRGGGGGLWKKGVLWGSCRSESSYGSLRRPRTRRGIWLVPVVLVPVCCWWVQL
jgi:hypothetical protein